MSISGIFELGKRSLLAYQSAIGTTSENISNVNNENYNRRRVDLSVLNAGFSGMGLSQQDVERMSNRFADQQIWSENPNLGSYQTSHKMLSQVESIFGPNTGADLANVMTEFWNAWNDLANDPGSDYTRNILRDKSLILTDTFQRLESDLTTHQQQTLPEIQTKVEAINQKAQQISDINSQIRTNNSPALYDERDRIITELSEMVNINVKTQDSGEVNIYADGYLLVTDEQVNELETEVVTQNGISKINLKLKDTDRDINISSGELGAMIDVHNNKIPEYKNQLDELARTLASEVNALHRTGENLNGTTNLDFFAGDVSGAADFRLNEAINQDPGLIASRLPTEAEGSGSIAQSISDVQFKKIFTEGTAADYYGSMMTSLGSSIQEASFLEQSQQLVIQQLQNQRDAVTGVSLDEEMTKLIQYEQAYQAAAKVVNTVDQMMETVLAMV